MLAPLFLSYLLDPNMFLYSLFFQSQDLIIFKSIFAIFPIFVSFLIVYCRCYPYTPVSLQWVD